MDNFLSYCGLANARISTSEKDLPVYMAKNPNSELDAKHIGPA